MIACNETPAAEEDGDTNITAPDDQGDDDDNGGGNMDDDDDDDDDPEQPPVENKGLKFWLASDGESYCVAIGICTDTDIVIPDSYDGKPVTTIGADGFMRSKVMSVLLPDTITTIGPRAFYDCNYLFSVNIPDGVTDIGRQAFAYTMISSAVLPESVTYIDSLTFYGCSNLEEVVIPNTVTEILSGAFLRCAKLKDIRFKGTTEEWGAIAKGGAWDCEEVFNTDTLDYDYLQRAYTVHCTNGYIAIERDQ